MQKKLPIISIIICLLTPFVAHSNQDAQILGVCLSDSLNGKERKNLARWIFFGMSAHSTIKPYANVSSKDIDDSNRYVASLITRLMTRDCPKQAKAAFQNGGTSAFEYAFGIVGQVAMQELMTEPAVSQALGAFDKYLDKDTFNKVFN